MEDTVNWKFQSKSEDDHEVAELFMASAKQWINWITFLFIQFLYRLSFDFVQMLRSKRMNYKYRAIFFTYSTIITI